MKRILKVLLKTILVILVVLNLVILCSGRWYLWKGIWNTYCKGRSGPSATEYAIFENRKVDAPQQAQPWSFTSSYNKGRLPDTLAKRLGEIKTHALLIIRNDSLLHEQYWDGFSDTSHTNSFSMAKTYVGLLLGCALKDGSIPSINEPVSTYIPEFKEGARSKVTLLHLLTMTSGIGFDESYVNPFAYPAEAYYGSDLMKATLKYDMAEEPGKVFRYQSGNSTLLARCINVATRKPLSQYLSEKLWQPMGSEHPAFWSLDRKDGIEKGYCCINSNARDFCRMGVLALHHGNWKGAQLVDSSYLAESVRAFDSKEPDGSPNSEYGYAWWITEYKGLHIFYARGILGQFVICIPEKNMVICRLGRQRRPKIPQGSCPVDITYCVEAAMQMYDKTQ